MSLKSFHLFFITLSTLMSILAAVYCLVLIGSNGGTMVTATGWGCVGLAVILPVYGFRFYQKLKTLNL